MNKHKTARLYPATITEVQDLPGGKCRMSMRTSGQTPETDPPTDRITVKNLDFTKDDEGQDGEASYSVEIETFIGAPEANQEVLIEFHAGEDRMDLHWPLPPKDPKLPVSLVLWCQLEERARWFGLLYGSTYECPCGEFIWDVFQRGEEE